MFIIHAGFTSFHSKPEQLRNAPVLHRSFTDLLLRLRHRFACNTGDSNLQIFRLGLVRFAGLKLGCDRRFSERTGHLKSTVDRAGLFTFVMAYTICRNQYEQTIACATAPHLK